MTSVFTQLVKSQQTVTNNFTVNITPTNTGDLLVIGFVDVGASSVTSITGTNGTSGTWTKINGTSGGTETVSVWWSISTSTTAGVLTCVTALAATVVSYMAYDVSNVNTAAIVQNAVGNGTVATSATATLSAFAASYNYAMAFGSSSGGSETAGTSMTALDNYTSTPTLIAMNSTTSGSPTSVVMNCSTGNVALVAFEISCLPPSGYKFYNDSRCQAAYLMQTGSGTSLIDSTANANTGTFASSGHPAWTTTIPTRSYLKYSLQWDATSNVTVSGLSFTKPNQAQTVCYWINTSVDSYGGGNPRVACRANLNDVAGMIATAAVVFFVTGGTQLTVSASNNTCSLNNWHHVMITWDGSTTATNVHIYVDGVEVSYQTQTNGATLTDNSAQTLNIGNRTDLTRSISGYLTEMAFFTAVLTPGDASFIYNNGLGETLSTIASRKTLSGIGSAVGKRQMQGWGQ